MQLRWHGAACTASEAALPALFGIGRPQAADCRHLKGGRQGVAAFLHPLLTPAALRACRQEEVHLAQRLRLHCQQCLGEAGPKRETAGVLLGRLMARSDCHVSLRCFVAWATVQLRCTGPEAVFLVPGVRTALCFPASWHVSACGPMRHARNADGTP